MAGLNCPVCGCVMEIVTRDVISKKLAEQWELLPTELVAFNHREGDICRQCGSSRRLWSLAAVIAKVFRERFSLNCSCLSAVSEVLHDYSHPPLIWECNNLSVLHQYIANYPNLIYSEFGVEERGVLSLDLMSIKLADESIDLILMTDVLEHVPDISRALQELHRVLGPKGMIILTVPLIMSRKTRKRAGINSAGEVEYYWPPSYHGDPLEKREDMLVYYEFGKDFVDMLEELFEISMYDDAVLADGIGAVFCGQKKN